MFCKNCGNQINPGDGFCKSCGCPVNNAAGDNQYAPNNSDPHNNQYAPNNSDPYNNQYAPNNNYPYNNQYAPNNNYPYNNQYAPNGAYGNQYAPNNNAGQNDKEDKCLPAFILGLIGGIMGLFGGYCMTLCTSIIDIVRPGTSTGAFIFIFCGSILGLVGACLCLKKALIGSIMQLFAALLIIIYAYTIGGEYMTVLAFLLFIAGGLVGLIFSIINRSKRQ